MTPTKIDSKTDFDIDPHSVTLRMIWMQYICNIFSNGILIIPAMPDILDYSLSFIINKDLVMSELIKVLKHFTVLIKPFMLTIWIPHVVSSGGLIATKIAKFCIIVFY